MIVNYCYAIQSFVNFCLVFDSRESVRCTGPQWTTCTSDIMFRSNQTLLSKPLNKNYWLCNGHRHELLA